jgi:hypothetical protein
MTDARVKSTSPALSLIVGTRRPGEFSFGRLTVMPDAILLDSWPIVRRLLIHKRRRVTYVHARFAPPCWNKALILRGDTRAYGVALPPGSVGRIRKALAEADFEVCEQDTRFFRFGSGAALIEQRRHGAEHQ